MVIWKLNKIRSNFPSSIKFQHFKQHQVINLILSRLVQEVHEIKDSIEYLHRKLQEAEAQHQQLLKTRSNLETELHNKVSSLFIDREKCMGMRRSFPITATIKY